MKIVFLTEGVGNHSNRLFEHINIDTFLKKKSVKFYNPTLFDIASNYKLKKNYNIFLNKLLFYFIKLLTKIKVIKPAELTPEIKLGFITFIRDSGFRHNEITENDKLYYRDLFSLSERIDESVLANFNNDYIKIGIHIRRGDYRMWNNGIYYYSDEQYINITKQLSSLFNGKIYYYIFSNEGLDEKKYKDELGDNIYFSKNDYFVDHYLMSICDYLIGPPSTFTAFASFIGKAKFYHIHDMNCPISLSNFKISNG